MDKSQQGPLLTLVGGAALAVGSFLAWGTVGGVGISGIDSVAGGDGWYTLIAGAAVAAAGMLAYLGNDALPTWLGWAGLAVGLGVALLNLFDIMDSPFDIGIGMWVMLAGGVVALVGLLQSR